MGCRFCQHNDKGCSAKMAETYFNLAVNAWEKLGQLVRKPLQVEVLALNGLLDELHRHLNAWLGKPLFGIGTQEFGVQGRKGREPMRLKCGVDTFGTL